MDKNWKLSIKDSDGEYREFSDGEMFDAFIFWITRHPVSTLLIINVALVNGVLRRKRMISKQNKIGARAFEQGMLAGSSILWGSQNKQLL